MRKYDPFNNRAVSYALDALGSPHKMPPEHQIAIVWLASIVNHTQTMNDPRVQAIMGRLSKGVLNTVANYKPRHRVKMGRKEVTLTTFGFSA